MCPTKPLLIHLVRGGVGVVLIIAAFSLAYSRPAVALLLGAGALAAFRGCPTCWIAGLFDLASTGKQAPPDAHAGGPAPDRAAPLHCPADANTPVGGGMKGPLTP